MRLEAQSIARFIARPMRSGLSTALLVVLMSLSGPIAAQPTSGTTIVVLRNFKFEPAQIELRAGVPITLRLQNISSGGHSFVAPSFFAAARIDPRFARLISNGRVEIPSHQSVELMVTPAAGNYPLKCGHTLHAMFGMMGAIIVR